MRILHVSNEQLYDASARDFDVKTIALLHSSHGQLNNANILTLRYYLKKENTILEYLFSTKHAELPNSIGFLKVIGT